MDSTSLILGYAALAFVLGGGLYIVIMLLGAAIAGSALVGVWRWRKRPWLMWPVLLVFAYSIWFLWLNKPFDNANNGSSRYKEVSYQQQDITFAACEKAQLALPEQLIVDGIVDEITNIDYSQLVSLLDKQKLKFVELRVKNAAVGPHIVQGDGSPHGDWLVDKPINSYVKVAVGSPATDSCTPGDQLPADLIRQFWPLKEVCITMTYLDRPSARYALDYVEDVPVNKDKTGQYRLVDRQQNITLAQLPTYDDPQRPNRRHPVPCRSPHAIVIKKLVGM